MHAFARVTVCVCVGGGGGGVGAIKQGGGAIKRGGGGHLPQMPPLWGRHWLLFRCKHCGLRLHTCKTYVKPLTYPFEH